MPISPIIKQVASARDVDKICCAVEQHIPLGNTQHQRQARPAKHMIREINNQLFNRDIVHNIPW
jgi:hypothetical protein